MQEVALGLRMKDKPPERSDQPDKLEDRGEPVLIQIVQNQDQLKKAFKARYDVYGRIMGYLPDEMMADPPGLDIDPYDDKSIHFVAITEKSQKVVGTVRLVLNYPSPRTASSSVFVKIPPPLVAHEGWTRAIAGGLRRRIEWLNTQPESSSCPTSNPASAKTSSGSSE